MKRSTEIIICHFKHHENVVPSMWYVAYKKVSRWRKKKEGGGGGFFETFLGLSVPSSFIIRNHAH